ncbi:MAG TPA: PIN domain nuclease [Pseudonocardiaceae bacterium]|nr:PIN domain nuclease [Pseudonocardiaceae bacterium]
MALRLIDSSVWIDFLRGKETKARYRMRELASQSELLATTEPVVMELRSGASDAALTRIEQMRGGLVQLGIDPAIDFSQAADLARAVRRTRHTVRSAVDCLIASVALRRDAILVHQDAGFERIGAVAPRLRLESVR